MYFKVTLDEDANIKLSVIKSKLQQFDGFNITSFKVYCYICDEHTGQISFQIFCTKLTDWTYGNHLNFKTFILYIPRI